jgi:glycosyltransferase involved in cell wall biosynthesis
MYPLLNITEAFDRASEFDIIHVHLNKSSDYMSFPLAAPIKNKVVFTLHFPYPATQKRMDRHAVLQKYKDLNFISISNSQRQGGENLNWVETVYNGIEFSQFTYNPTPKDYFLWLGKFNPDKGTKEAIMAARQAGVKLFVAGKIDNLEGEDLRYYEEDVKPLIDNQNIIYIEELGTDGKNKIFGEAIAFLNPIKWNEPFGLVMAEAMATGTPVISFKNGAAPEIVVDGETGFLVDNIEQMVAKIGEVKKIDRKACRDRVEKHFTSEIMVDNYVKAYAKLDKSH